MEKLYIILPVYNRVETTLKFIDALKEQTFKNYTLILVDDGSTDGTSEKVQSLLSDIVIIKGKGNWWWAGSIQQAYKWLNKNAIQNSFALIINDDLIFENNFLQKGIDYLKQNPFSFILAAAYNQDNPHILEDCGVIYNFKKNRITSCDLNQLDKLNCLSTRGLFMYSKDFLMTKGFRPKLLPHYYSDYEFTIRAKRKYGIQLKCFADLKVFMNVTSTGIEKITYKGWREYLKKSFSKRFKTNPRYAFTYYLITFPFPYNFIFAFKVLKKFIKTFISVLFRK